MTSEVLGDLRDLVPLAPDHLPGEIEPSTRSHGPFRMEQVACFDTAFHRTLPDQARRFALPWNSTTRASGGMASTDCPISTLMRNCGG